MLTLETDMAAPFDAFFLPVPGDTPGHRFCIFHPAQGADAKGAVLFIHPFGEEMNKSRRMAALQSRAFAVAGYAVLQIDLLGCGDSSGDFGDASWQDWIDDVVRGTQWLAERVQAPLWLWGLRVGCLLAVEAARRLPGDTNFLFWAPVSAGKQSLQQFMRLKAASGLGEGNAKAVMAEFRDALAKGASVEIAGYSLSPAIAAGLEQSSMTPPANLASQGRVEWLELSTREQAELSPVGAKSAAMWREAGFARTHTQMVQGPSFWQTAEIEDAPQLIARTTCTMLDETGS
jgi:exosortase A-associated hydrolase 2